MSGIRKMPKSPGEIPELLFDLMSKECGQGPEGEIVLREGSEGGRRYVIRPLKVKTKDGNLAHLMLVTGMGTKNETSKSELRLYDHQVSAVAKTAVAYVTGYRELENSSPDKPRKQFCRVSFGDQGLEMNGNNVMAVLAFKLAIAALELAAHFPETLPPK